jgi:hypothetical protein
MDDNGTLKSACKNGSTSKFGFRLEKGSEGSYEPTPSLPPEAVR